MIKRCKYWKKRPVRDEISVENEYRHAALRRPVRDEISCCVPNGTPGLVRASTFYQYRIPNGMTKRKRHFIDNMTRVTLLKQKII